MPYLVLHQTLFHKHPEVFKTSDILSYRDDIQEIALWFDQEQAKIMDILPWDWLVTHDGIEMNEKEFESDGKPS